MKSLFFFFILFASSTTICAQDNLSFNICENSDSLIIEGNGNKSSISVAGIIDCPELHTTDDNWRIDYFEFSISTKNNKDETVVIAIKENSNKITEKIINTIKKYSPAKIYFDQIMLINKAGKFGRGKPLIISIKK